MVGAGLTAYGATRQLEKVEETLFLFGHKPPLPEKGPLSQKEIEEFKDTDALLLFCPGGFGHTSLQEDPGFKELLENVQIELKNQGYPTKILEELRRKSYFSSFWVENTVMKIKQLTDSFSRPENYSHRPQHRRSFYRKCLKILP